MLEQIGLSKGESKVYLALLRLGSTTTGPITDESGVSRSKIYNILGRLMAKGMVSYILKQRTKYYQAAEPSRLTEYMDRKEENLKAQRKKVQELIPRLESEYENAVRTKEAQIYFGFRGIRAAHEHLYSRLKKGDDVFFLGVPSFQPEKYHQYWKKDHLRRMEAGIRIRILYNRGANRSELKNRNGFDGSEARYLPIDVETPSWIMGYKDTTIIGLQTGAEMAIEILNQEIADSFRRYFDAFWKLSRKFQ